MNEDDLEGVDINPAIAAALEGDFQETIEGLATDHPMSRSESIRRMLDDAEREARYMRTETGQLHMMTMRIDRLRGDLDAIERELDRLEAHYDGQQESWLEAATGRVLAWIR